MTLANPAIKPSLNYFLAVSRLQEDAYWITTDEGPLAELNIFLFCPFVLSWRFNVVILFCFPIRELNWFIKYLTKGDCFLVSYFLHFPYCNYRKLNKIRLYNCTFLINQVYLINKYHWCTHCLSRPLTRIPCSALYLLLYIWVTQCHIQICTRVTVPEHLYPNTHWGDSSRASIQALGCCSQNIHSDTDNTCSREIYFSWRPAVLSIWNHYFPFFHNFSRSHGNLIHDWLIRKYFCNYSYIEKFIHKYTY